MTGAVSKLMMLWHSPFGMCMGSAMCSGSGGDGDGSLPVWMTRPGL